MAGPWPIRSGGVVTGAGFSPFPLRPLTSPRWVRAGATSLRPRPLDIPPRSLGPGGLVGYGLGHCGSSKTGPRPGRSVFLRRSYQTERGVYGYRPRKPEPGARGAAWRPRSGWGSGPVGVAAGEAGVLFLGPGWVLLRVGTSGSLSVRAGGWRRKERPGSREGQACVLSGSGSQNGSVNSCLFHCLVVKRCVGT